MGNDLTIGSGGGIKPSTLDDAYRLAKAISLSGLAPEGMKEPEKILVAILTGLEIGLPPMYAIQKIAVVNGRPVIWGDAIPAMLWSKGFNIEETDDPKLDGGTATCRVTRPDGKVIVRSFSMKQAQFAGLLSKKGPWQQYPERMRQMRARAFAARDGAADILGGLYLREEIDDEQMKDITPKPAPLPDLPDIPDVAPAAADDGAELVLIEAGTDEPLADPDGFIEHLRGEIATLNTVEELAELRDANADMLARLPAAHRKVATALLSEEGEL